MKQFTDIKALAKDFTANAMQSPRCPAGNIIYIVKLVNATLTIRCYPSQPNVVNRAKKLISAYAVAIGGTSGFKQWKKATNIRKKMSAAPTANKRPPFSWIMARELLEDNEANAVEYFKIYNKTPYYCVGNPSPKNDTLILDVTIVDNFPDMVIGRMHYNSEYCAFHIPSGMTLTALTASKTRAGALSNLINEMEGERVKNGIEAQKDNTFQKDKLAAMGITL